MPAFTVGQNLDPDSFVLTDISEGSDGAITDRRIYIQQADGQYLVPTGTLTSYVPFPLSGGAAITISVLNVDYALSITVQWLNVSGTILYTLSQSYPFTEHDEQFMYGLVQYMAANRSILQDTTFINNCFEIDMYVSFAQKAVYTGNDISSSQFLLDLAQNMVDNQNDFF